MSRSNAAKIIAYGKRVIRVRSTQQRLYGKQNGPNLQSGGPFVFQDIKADSTELVCEIKGTHGISIAEVKGMCA